MKSIYNIYIMNNSITTCKYKFKCGQNTQQRLLIISQFGMEFYKILTGCFLLFFVPQQCGSNTCRLKDIININSLNYKLTLYLNSLTFILFVILYCIELYRENTLIKYMEVNPKKARDNNSVNLELENLDKKKRNKIIYNRILYNNIGKICFILFIINSLISGVILYQRQVGSKTISVYFTNILFTITKLENIYEIVNAEKNVFLSSYMLKRVQYNDIDPYHLEIKKDISNCEIISNSI
jgi:hypothetical protein